MPAVTTRGSELVVSDDDDPVPGIGREAGIEPSRTLASLNWRIAHNTLQLSLARVAVLDLWGSSDFNGV